MSYNKPIRRIAIVGTSHRTSHPAGGSSRRNEHVAGCNPTSALLLRGDRKETCLLEKIFSIAWQREIQ